MKKIPFVLLGLMLIIFQGVNSQETDILNFECTEDLECYQTSVYAQYFTLPAGNDYCVTQIGVQLDSKSAAVKIYFGLYNESGVLLFKSKEVQYPG